MVMSVAEPKDKGLTLDGIIRANIAVVSTDPVFNELISAELPKHGFKVIQIPAEALAKPRPVPDVYLVDLLGVKDYGKLINVITSIKTANPDSKFVAFPSPDQVYATEFEPVRVADRRNILEDTYKRPILQGDSEQAQAGYRRTLDLFVQREIVDYLKKILSKPYIIKIGGSIFDLVANKPYVLENLLREIGELHKTYPLILTTGGGPRQDVERELVRQLPLLQGSFEDSSRRVLETQASTITSLLSMMNVDAVYVPPEDLHLLDVSGNYLRKHVPVVSLSNGQYPASESDTHTLVIADHLLIPDVKFAKNTDGIYRRDPNIKCLRLMNRLRKELRKSGLNLFEIFGKRNEFLPQIQASEILAGKISRYSFDRDGLLSSGHVIEDGALHYLIEQARYVQRVHIINGTKPGTLTTALEGKRVGSYISDSI